LKGRALVVEIVTAAIADWTSHPDLLEYRARNSKAAVSKTFMGLFSNMGITLGENGVTGRSAYIERAHI
jgi:hypothetical protein